MGAEEAHGCSYSPSFDPALGRGAGQTRPHTGIFTLTAHPERVLLQPHSIARSWASSDSPVTELRTPDTETSYQTSKGQRPPTPFKWLDLQFFFFFFKECFQIIES